MSFPTPLQNRKRLLFLLLLIRSRVLNAQQPYVNNHQLDCYNQEHNATTLGFRCNGARKSCLSYLTFRSSPPYTSPVTIAYLLDASPSVITVTNRLSSDMVDIPEGQTVVVPVNCSCFSGKYYQHDASYSLKSEDETYFSVANNTYEGLTTCQALMDQNEDGSRNLRVGLVLKVPLRCACPSLNQTSGGIRYLLSYMVTWGDTISAIARLFGAEMEAVMEANELSGDVIFPFTPLLVPLASQLTNFSSSSPTAAATPPAAPPPPPEIVPPGASNHRTTKTTWVHVGVGFGAGAVTLLAFLGFLLWYHKFFRKAKPAPPQPAENKPAPVGDEYTLLPSVSNGVRDAVRSLTVYRFDDVQSAAGFFSDENRIKGNVYRAVINGDSAAIKAVSGDVSDEIHVLQTVSHANIIRLSGFCVHEGKTYLVYEHAENGSLHDWLHPSKKKPFSSLSWKQRVQVAYDTAAAISYLHSYANPPLIHKNLKPSNILLDANLRAKITNFGSARTLSHSHGAQLTQHVIGTQGYMAPEYIQDGMLTPKLDVFSFGVVLLELISGREAAWSSKGGLVVPQLLHEAIDRVLGGDHVREKICGFVDPLLGNEYPLDLVFSMAQLAQSCVARELNQRPDMSHVHVTLSKILSSSQHWDPSDLLQSSDSFSYGGR